MPNLVLENRHTGEVLTIRRTINNGQPCLTLSGTLPPHSQGPPLHVHLREAEAGRVVAGTLSAVLDGKTLQVPAGGRAAFPVGAAHRWWNDGDEQLVFEGEIRPAVDFDRYVQAVFEILNAGPSDRPSLFYIAHVSWRHRDTQAVLFMPRPLQRIVVPIVVAIGTLLGRYRGHDWPGAPERCTGAPADDALTA